MAHQEVPTSRASTEPTDNMKEEKKTNEDDLLPQNWRVLQGDHSFRVKSLAFHSTKPWIAVGRHSGSCVVKDYSVSGAAENVVAHWDAHEGACRSVAFHPSRPFLLASAGDDSKVKLWKTHQRECSGTLTGHLDYVRSVQFHPVRDGLLLSASDDQTLRLWDWKLQTSLCVVTGHCHYVMSAVFHPTQDLLLSASLDQTARLWSFTTTTTTGPATVHDAEDGKEANSLASVSVEHIATIVGHDKGLNYAAFHPTQPRLVTAADDKTVRVWEQSPIEGAMVAVQTIEGHTGNVCSAIFVGASGSEVLSVSEDRSLRHYSVAKRTLLDTICLPGRRLWTCVAREGCEGVTGDPSATMLVAVGHDAGFHIYEVARNAAASMSNGLLDDPDDRQSNSSADATCGDKLALLNTVAPSPEPFRGVTVGADQGTGSSSKKHGNASSSSKLAQFDVGLLRRAHRPSLAQRYLPPVIAMIVIGALAAVMWLLGEIALVSLACNGAFFISASADFLLGAAALSLIRGASMSDAKWWFLGAIVMDGLRLLFHSFAAADRSTIGRAVAATDSVSTLISASGAATLWMRAAVDALLQHFGTTLQKSPAVSQTRRVLRIWGAYLLSCGLHAYFVFCAGLSPVAVATIVFSACAGTYRWGSAPFQKLVLTPWHPVSCGCDAHQQKNNEADSDFPDWESLEWENEVKLQLHGMPLADFVEELKASCGMVPANRDPSQSDVLQLYRTNQPAKCLVSLGMLQNSSSDATPLCVLCRSSVMNSALDIGERCCAIPNQWISTRKQSS